MALKIDGAARKAWQILYLAARRYFEMDGSQWAGAFAYFAFFSLFPVVILVVTIASGFIDRDQVATAAVRYVEHHLPMGAEMRRPVADAVAGVIHSRGQAGVIAVLMLVWVALQCFTTLICATNRAWGTRGFHWWGLPLRSLALLGIMAAALFLGVTAPVAARAAEAWLSPYEGVGFWVYHLAGRFVPLVLLFVCLTLFYRLAPCRPTRLAEVWPAALCVTLLVRGAESVFVIYLRDYATLNAVYGAFGAVMALLLWVYVCGGLFIFGACVCAAQAEADKATAPAGAG